MNGELEDARRRRFRWGVLLAWSPFILLLLPTLIDVLRGISSEKATGLGAVAGGLAEALVNFGIIVLLVFEVSAIALLMRSFSKEHFARGLFSVLSICCSGVMLFGIGLFLWFFLVYIPHHR